MITKKAVYDQLKAHLPLYRYLAIATRPTDDGYSVVVTGRPAQISAQNIGALTDAFKKISDTRYKQLTPYREGLEMHQWLLFGEVEPKRKYPVRRRKLGRLTAHHGGWWDDE
jgi:hypothetical protein